jgi:hemoglobin
MNETLYEVLGGEAPLRQLVETFYRIMDTADEVKELRAMHSQDLSEASQKLFEFLSGWLGGPTLFEAKYGHPRLRARHMPFSIGEKERDQWLYCMAKALEVCKPTQNFSNEFYPAIANLANHMRNRRPE